MLFDLEDYRIMGITGKDHVHVHQIKWDDAWIAQRATLDTYYNTIREYGETAVAMAPASEVSTILEKSFIALEKLSSFRKISKEFWNAMCSIVIVGSFNEGDKFDYTTVYIDDVVDGVDYQDLTWSDDKRIMNPYKFVAFRNENGEFEYRSMTQALYNSYYTALTDSQSAVKTLMLTGEGVSTIAEFVPPLVPAWNDGAELSGYVRDSRSLPISGATVRLVDADGVNHDLVANDLGYYHFTKEYIYNNISLGTASSAEFDMFILEETISGTVLYNQTNIFQNSFFGAVNDRGLSWPVLVKSGKQNRRNFKIEFTPDYSAYPSLSGTILDQDGNPVANALVELFTTPVSFTRSEGEWASGSDNASIGAKYNGNNTWTKSSKYTLFGEEKSLLTDENGYYEYSSQMIGEWVHKEYLKYINSEHSSSITTLSNILLNDPTTPAVGYYNNSSIFGKGVLGVNYNDGDNHGWYEFECGPVVQPDGKIIIAGSFESYDTTSLSQIDGNGNYIPNKTSIIRLNVDGTLDTTFDVDITNCFGSSYTNYFTNIVLQPDGKILLYGNIGSVHGTQLGNYRTMVRLNQDGTLDTVFDFATLNYSDQDIVGTIKVMSDGKIITALRYSQNDRPIVRFNSDGTIDDTFVLPIDIRSFASNSTVKAIFEDSDGSIFLAGKWIGTSIVDIDGNAYDYPGIIKFNSDLTIDTTFRCPFSPNGDLSSLIVESIIKEENGTYLVGGRFNLMQVDGNDVEVSNIIRINADGSLNNRFPGASSEWSGGIIDYGIFSPIRKLSLVETPVGKRIIVYGAYGLFQIDYSTGLQVQQFSGTDNAIAGFTIHGSDIYLTGRFVKYYEQSDVNSTHGEIRNLAPGIAKLNYGNYDFEKKTTHPWSRGYEYNEGIDHKYSSQWTINQVQCYLNPWIQDTNGTVYDYDSKIEGIAEPTKIYNYQNWFNSRFPYAANERYGERYLLELHGGEGKDVTLDIHEMLVDQEYGGEIIEVRRRNGDTAIIKISTTTGFATVLMEDGTYQIFGSGDPDVKFYMDFIDLGFTPYDPASGKSIQTWADEYLYCHIFSSEQEHGAASGKIKSLSIKGGGNDPESGIFSWSNVANVEILNGSLRNLTQIEELTIANGTITELDVTGMTSLRKLYAYNDWRGYIHIIGLETLNNLEAFRGGATTYSDKTLAPITDTSFVYEPSRAHWKYSSNMDYPKWWIGDNLMNSKMTKLANGKILLTAPSMYSAMEFPSANTLTNHVNWNDLLNGSVSARGLMILDENYNPERTSPLNYYNVSGNFSLFNGSEVFTHCVQSTGKIVVGGQISHFKGSELPQSKQGVIRIDQNGNKDNSFNFQLDTSSPYSINDIICLQDDTMVIVGSFQHNGQQATLARLTANGGFIWKLNIGIMQSALAIQDGKILVIDVNDINRVYRYKLDGSLDETFGTSGSFYDSRFRISNTSEGRNSMTVDSDGKIYLSIMDNYIDDVTDPLYRSGLLRLNIDGSIDTDWTNQYKLNMERFGTWGNYTGTFRTEGVFMLNDDKVLVRFGMASGGESIIEYGGFNGSDVNDINASKVFILKKDGSIIKDSINIYWGEVHSALETEDGHLLLAGYNMESTMYDYECKGVGTFGVFKKNSIPTFDISFPSNNNRSTAIDYPQYDTEWGSVEYPWGNGFTLLYEYPQLFKDSELDYSGFKSAKWLGLYPMNANINISGLTSLEKIRINNRSKLGSTYSIITSGTIYNNLTEIFAINFDDLGKLPAATNLNELKLLYSYNSWNKWFPKIETISNVDMSKYPNVTRIDVSGASYMDQIIEVASNPLVNYYNWQFEPGYVIPNIDTLLSQLVVNGQENGYLYFSEGRFSASATSDYTTLVNRGWSISGNIYEA